MTDPDPMASLREWAAIFVDSNRQTPPAPLADFVDLLARFDAQAERIRELETQRCRAIASVVDALAGNEPQHELGRSVVQRIRDVEVERDASESVIAMAVARLGGHIEQRGPGGKLHRHETHRGNFLQRIDDLRATETERDRLKKALYEVTHGGEPLANLDELLEGAEDL